MNRPRIMKCPICKKTVQWENNPDRPFCSERCRLVDLVHGIRRVPCPWKSCLRQKRKSRVHFLQSSIYQPFTRSYICPRFASVSLQPYRLPAYRRCRTALFNWLLAENSAEPLSCGLRIPMSPVLPGVSGRHPAGMEWLGLNWDEGPFYQSDNFPLYKEYVQKLLAEGRHIMLLHSRRAGGEAEKALAEGRKPKYDGTCRSIGQDRPGQPYVVRSRRLTRGTAFNDLIKGPISFSNSELDDLIIQRTTEHLPTIRGCGG